MLTLRYYDFPITAGETVIDVGCGEGRHIIDVAIRYSVTAIGIDLCEKDLRSARKKMQDCAIFSPATRADFIQVDARILPFEDNSIDKIICSEVLEHIPAYTQVLQDMVRVLKPGGRLVVSVPRYWPEKICWWLSRAYHEVEGGHIRIFNAQQLQTEITQLGLTAYKKHWAHALHSPYWWLRCIFWNSQENNILVKIYHQFLVWDLMDKPWFTRTLEKLLNPLLGKSVVMYFRK